MVNRNLVRDFDVSEAELEQAIQDSLGAPADEALPQAYIEQNQEFEPNKLVNGKVLNVFEDEVWIDVGYKSEGIIPLIEWYDEGLD